MFKLNTILGVDFFISVLWIVLVFLIILPVLIFHTLCIVIDDQTQHNFGWQLCVSRLSSLFLHFPTLANLAWETFVK